MLGLDFSRTESAWRVSTRGLILARGLTFFDPAAMSGVPIFIIDFTELCVDTLKERGQAWINRFVELLDTRGAGGGREASDRSLTVVPLAFYNQLKNKCHKLKQQSMQGVDTVKRQVCQGEAMETLARAADKAFAACRSLLDEARVPANATVNFTVVSLAGFALAGVGALGFYLQSRKETSQTPPAPTWGQRACKLMIGGGLAVAAVATCCAFLQAVEVAAICARAGSIFDIVNYEMLAARRA